VIKLTTYVFIGNIKANNIIFCHLLITIYRDSDKRFLQHQKESQYTPPKKRQKGLSYIKGYKLFKYINFWYSVFTPHVSSSLCCNFFFERCCTNYFTNTNFSRFDKIQTPPVLV